MSGYVCKGRHKSDVAGGALTFGRDKTAGLCEGVNR